MTLRINFLEAFPCTKNIFILFFEFVWTLICVTLDKIFDLISSGSIFKLKNKSFQVDEKNNDIRPLLLDFQFMMSKYANEIWNVKCCLRLWPKLKFEGNQFVYGLTITILKLSQVKQDRKIIPPPSTIWLQLGDE